MGPNTQEEWQDDEINLLDYWRVLRKRGRMILALVFVSVVTMGFLSYFVMTKIYESRASILAPKESSGGSAGLAAALAASGVGQFLGNILPPTGSNRDIFVAILKSRTMAQDLVERFHLKEYYKAKYTDDAIKGLQGATDILVSKEGVISISVEDKDPKLAADIANAYVTNLDRLFAKLGTTDASRQRAFIAERLDKTEKALRQAEETLRRFQESNKAIVVQEQAKGALEEAAKVKGQIVAAEAQMEFLRSFSTESNPQVVAQRRQIDELKRHLAQMQYGAGMELPPESPNPGQPRREFQVPFTKVPELGMELIRLTREVKVQETVYSLLTAQFEQAKINEARDTPTVQFLDKALPAERKSKPTTRVNMAIAGALSLFVGIFLAFFLEYVERMRKQETVSAGKPAS
jgi:tyrosine-protein kinase Etk/Wzc